MKSLFLLASLFAASSLMASPITQKQAQSQARQFFAARGVQMQTSARSHRAPSATAQDESSYYVFNAGNDKGYVIVSGDDRTEAILGYSTTGSFSYDEAPENMKAWLDGYAREIEWVKQHAPATASAKGTARRAPAVRASIAPLLTTTWNQTTPYNDACPDFFTYGKAVTGCVATSMAQVMYFHRNNSVSATQTEIPAYQCSSNWSGLGKISVEAIPAGTPIEWEKMKNSFESSESGTEAGDAVASLMAMCGASVEMDYKNAANGGSGAVQAKVATALKTYFGYQRATTCVERDNYLLDDWISLIYSELASNRPVVYGGQSNAGGHSFVVDGYDADNRMFHVNWGWGGTSDDYFVLSVLTPEDGGTGAGDFASGYNSKQDAIVYAQPIQGTDTSTEDVVVTPVEVTISGSTISYEAANKTSSDISFLYGIGIIKDGTITVIDYKDHYDGYGDYYRNLPSGYQTSSAEFKVTLDADVTEAKIVPCFKIEGEDIWRTAWTSSRYILATKDGEGNITLTQYPIENAVADIKASVTKVDGPMKAYTQTNVTYSVANTGTIAYAPKIYIWNYLQDATPALIDSASVEIESGDSREFTYTYIPTTAGKYVFDLTLDKERTQLLGSSTYTITEGDAVTGIITAASIDNAWTDMAETDDDGIVTMPVEGTSLKGNVTVRLMTDLSGSYPMLPLIYKYNETAGDYTDKVSKSSFTYSNASGNTGDEKTAELDFENLSAGKYKVIVKIGSKPSGVYDIPTPVVEATGYIFEVAPRLDVKSTETLALTEASYRHISLTRSFKAGWSTLCLPYATTPADLGVKLYELSSVVDGALNFSTVGDAEATVANKPYLVFAEADVNIANKLLPFTAVESEMDDTQFGNVTFKGNYAAGFDMQGYYGVANTAEGSSIAKGAAGSRLNATSAYFDITGVGAKSLAITIDGEDQTTAIRGLDAEAETNGQPVFNLRGQQVGTTTSGLPKGVYIQNGRKVIVK